MNWVDTLRLSLLISLSLLIIYLLARRFKLVVMAKDLPVPLHAEVLSLQVLYHPARLRVEVRLPRSEVLSPAMLDLHHALVHQWPEALHGEGNAVLELPLPDGTDGDHFLQLSTSSQRTVRKFSLKRA